MQTVSKKTLSIIGWSIVLLLAIYIFGSIIGILQNGMPLHTK